MMPEGIPQVRVNTTCFPIVLGLENLQTVGKILQMEYQGTHDMNNTSTEYQETNDIKNAQKLNIRKPMISKESKLSIRKPMISKILQT